MSFVSEFIKSSISKVVGAATFPYSIDDRDQSFDSANSIWSLHRGHKKDDNSPVSFFVFEIAKNRSMVTFAQHAVKKIKSIRHPNMLKFLDSLENDNVIYIVTERVNPLPSQLDQLRSKLESIFWGLFTIAHAVSFLNNNAALIHGNIRLNTVFVSQSGEWKLGGLELISPASEPGSWLMTNGGSLPDCSRYLPPEVRKHGWSSIASNHVWATDSWYYGCFLFECFNSTFTRPEQLTQIGAIPNVLIPHYQRLMTNDPKTRPSVAEILQYGTSAASFFDTDVIRTANFLENITVKDNGEKIQFFKNLPNILEKFPSQFSKYKILPVLMNALEFGSAGPKILATILRIGSEFLSEQEYTEQIVGLISRLFLLQDRATRLSLLENLNSFNEKVDKRTINDKIFTQMLTGFNDTVPLMRESTLKAVTTVASQLNDRNLNELLRHLAKLQVDEEPGIRVNAVICLGKISKHLSESMRQKVLITAFVKSLRDPFPPSRSAALLALGATNEYYEIGECCNKIMPCITSLLIDPEKIVRDQAFKTLETFTKRAHSHSTSMPSSQLPQGDPNAVQIKSSTLQQVESVPSGDSGWGGWAVTAFTKKISEGVDTISGGIMKPNTAADIQQQSALSITKSLTVDSQKPVSIPTIHALNTTDSGNNAPSISNSDGWGSGWGNDDDIFPNMPNSTMTDSMNTFIPKIAPPPAGPSSISVNYHNPWQSTTKTPGRDASASLKPMSTSNNGSMKLVSSSNSSRLMYDLHNSLNTMSLNPQDNLPNSNGWSTHISTTATTQSQQQQPMNAMNSGWNTNGWGIDDDWTNTLSTPEKKDDKSLI